MLGGRNMTASVRTEQLPLTGSPKTHLFNKTELYERTAMVYIAAPLECARLTGFETCRP